MEGHDVPSGVLTGVVHWLREGGRDPVAKLDVFRRSALEGSTYCRNDGCQVKGQPKEFKVCPQCKTARYCVPETGLDDGRAQDDMWQIPDTTSASDVKWYVDAARSCSSGRCTRDV
jgi:hypothetical protein